MAKPGDKIVEGATKERKATLLNSEGKDINPARISSKPLVVITDDDKFDRIMQHTLPQYLYVRRTYSSLMKSTLDWRDVTPSLLWIDLPVGLQLRATKIESLSGLLFSLTQVPENEHIYIVSFTVGTTPR